MEDQQSDYSDSDNELDNKKHNRLLDELKNLDGKLPVKKPSRTEPTLAISEYNLVKSITGNKDSVHLHELTKPLRERASHVEISKKIKKSDAKTKTLPKPLEKPQAEKIRRTVAYEKTKEDLDKWEPVVTAHRAATHLSFPLDQDTKLDKKVTLKANYVIKTPLQAALEALEPPKVEVYEIEKEDEVPLTLQEMLERRKELAQLRRHQSYKEIKTRMQNKIKSKKYRKVLRREKAKEQLKEFEVLQKTNPEEALKKLEEIERSRAEERASLRHKTTGKWAKNRQIRAKYDQESRQELAQQLAISRDLTTKQKPDSDSEDDEDEEEIPINPTELDNCWTNGVKPEKEIVDFLSGYRKFWEGKPVEKKNEENSEDVPEENGLKEVDNVEEGCEELNLKSEEKVKKKGAKVKKIFEEEAGDELSEEILEQENKKVKDKSEELNLKSEEKVKKKMKKKGAKVKNIFEEENKEVKKKKGKKKIVPVIEDKKVSQKTKKRQLETSESEEDTPITKKKKKTKKTIVLGPSGEWSVDDTYIDDMTYKLEGALKTKLEKRAKKLKRQLNVPLTKKEKMTKNQTKKSKKKIDLTLKKQVQKQEIDEELHETIQKVNDTTTNKDLETLKLILKANVPKPTDHIEPDKFIKAKPVNLDTETPDLFTTEDNEEETNARGIIAEAFEDEDITEDFQKEKKDEIDNDTPKDIDLTLPGWGSWGGKGIKTSKAKKNRFIVRLPKELPRRDKNKGDLIINENASKAIKAHMVSELPFPFKSVKDYEASIRAPIGATFVPQTAFVRLTKPAMTTKLGAIIEPMSEEVLLKKLKKKFKV